MNTPDYTPDPPLYMATSHPGLCGDYYNMHTPEGSTLNYEVNEERKNFDLFSVISNVAFVET